MRSVQRYANQRRRVAPSDCIGLLDAFSILVPTNRILLQDCRALLDDFAKVALVNFEFHPVRLRKVVGSDVYLSPYVSKIIRGLKRNT